jgi:hypothetical protein
MPPGIKKDRPTDSFVFVYVYLQNWQLTFVPFAIWEGVTDRRVWSEVLKSSVRYSSPSFFTQGDLIWVGDIGTEPKKRFL